MPFLLPKPAESGSQCDITAKYSMQTQQNCRSVALKDLNATAYILFIIQVLKQNVVCFNREDCYEKH